MLPKELLDIIKDVPESIAPTVPMKEPNIDLPVYEGMLNLKAGDLDLEVMGKITFSWNPRPQAVLSARIPYEKKNWGIERYEVYIDGVLFGNCLIISKTLTNFADELPIYAIFTGPCVLGDRSIGVSEVRFSVPNMDKIRGSNTYTLTDNNGLSQNANRLEFSAGVYKITIDWRQDYEEMRDNLSWKGGYMVLYGGRIARSDGKPLTLEEVRNDLYSVGRFLSFLNGKRTTPIFLHGVHEGEVLWRDYTEFNVQRETPARSWSPKMFNPQIGQLLTNFFEYNKDKDDDYALDVAIHWYTEANTGAGYLEGSTIMAQSALELLYNWILIEKMQLIKGKDAENISAANKIRLLLSQMKIDYMAPASFVFLNGFIEDTPEIADAPEATVYVRNAIVHAQLEKRKKLQSIPLPARQQALELTLWYIEMALLFVLGYNAGYVDRRNAQIGNMLSTVPWQELQNKLFANAFPRVG